MEEQKEKVEFQFIMNYKAYRRKMIAERVAVSVALAAAACGLCVFSVIVGILVAAIVLIFGAVSVLLSLGSEQTYTVYNTRVVLKRRDADKRISVPLENIVSVKYKRAFYEKDLATGTLTVSARSENGKIKKYRLRHIFNAAPAIDYINAAIKEQGHTQDDNADNNDRK